MIKTYFKEPILSSQLKREKEREALQVLMFR